MRENSLIDTKEGFWRGAQPLARVEASGAFFWLCAFFVVYCARPQDWIPGLDYLPLAKITGASAFLALLGSLGKTQRKFKDLPREWFYLLAMVGVLFLSALFSPIWRGGALNSTIDFAKVCIAWVLTFPAGHEFQKTPAHHLHSSGFGDSHHSGLDY